MNKLPSKFQLGDKVYVDFNNIKGDFEINGILFTKAKVYYDVVNYTTLKMYRDIPSDFLIYTFSVDTLPQ